jgi:DNA-binding NarL/FixJ family response regulator
MTNTGRILIVEDQYLVANDCEFHLKSAGFDCVGLASTADEALELACRTKPDVIVMDVRLANRSDGVRVAIEIFERFGIRCIFTSGHADSATREQATPAHPLGWLNKPYMPEDLIAAVRAACSESRAH